MARGPDEGGERRDETQKIYYCRQKPKQLQAVQFLKRDAAVEAPFSDYNPRFEDNLLGIRLQYNTRV